MLTIAIDSSQDIATLALGLNSQLLAEYHFHHKMTLLKRLIPHIDMLLDNAMYKSSDIDGIIVSLGPGSFTGLRVGVTTAKALAWTLGKPIVGVPTLDAIARGSANSASELVCPMIFARADEVYWSLFDSSTDVRLEDYGVAKINHVLEAVEKHGVSVRFCGTGATRNAEAIRHRFGNNATESKPWEDFARGAALLELGNKRLQEGHLDDAATLAPMYIRKPTPVVKLETGEFEKSKV